MNGRLHFLASLAVRRGERAGSWRHRLAAASLWFAGFSVLAIGVPGAVFAVPAGSASVKQAAGTATGLGVVPKPVSATIGSGQFTLTGRARIVSAPGANAAAESAVAGDLAAYLRPSTGYRLATVIGTPRPGDIVLEIGDPVTLGPGHRAEGYQLIATTSGVKIEAPTAHGLYNGIQTFRQLLPPWINSPAVVPGPWTMPVVTITDYPRYAYRGLLLDIARHYEPPSAVEKLINQVAAYKIDVLHLHLSDDQGFRLAIKGFPRLTAIGSRGSVGTDGRPVDPGGFWTQAQYRAVVADAAAHFITRRARGRFARPQQRDHHVRVQRHRQPALPANPHAIDCGAYKPPHWDYTEDVGYSALCPGSRNTWAIMTAIIGQLTAMHPRPLLRPRRRRGAGVAAQPAAVRRLHQQGSGHRHRARQDGHGLGRHRRPGTRPPAGSVAEYWQPAGGTSPGPITGREAVAKHMKIVMAPANHTYLDQKYVVGARSSVPPTLGMNWACPRGCDVSSAYNWNPGGFVTGVTDRNVIGVEGAMWGETVANLANADYMVFPRLLALAEIAWSPSAQPDRNQPRLPRLPAAPRRAGRPAAGGRGELLPLGRSALAADGHRGHPDR